MAGLDKIRREQLELGMADWFRPYPESIAPFNQIEVDAGVFFPRSEADPRIFLIAQTSPSFVVVAAGFYRYDLVYLDKTGTPQKQQGTAKTLPVVPYTGAPGQAGGPVGGIDKESFPVAYVLITETGTVVVDASDITDIRGIYGHYEKGIDGDMAADGTAKASTDGSWKFISSKHRHPLNTDALDPEDTDRDGPPVPGSSGIYADRAHVHQVDPSLEADVLSLLGASSAFMDRADTLYVAPKPADWADTYEIHQFQGRMMQYSTGLPSSVWGTLLPTTAPVSAKIQLAINPGFADGTSSGWPAAGAKVDYWFYLYLIAKADGSLSAVWSDNPPEVGPDLSAAVFTGPGWDYYRYICAGVNISDGADFEIVPITKMGDEVEFQNAQNMNIVINAAWFLQTLARRVPPTSNRAKIRLAVSATNGNIELQAKPGNVYEPLTYDPYPEPTQEEFKLRAGVGWDLENTNDANQDYMDTDSTQNIYHRVLNHAGGYAGELHVLGYKELADGRAIVY